MYAFHLSHVMFSFAVLKQLIFKTWFLWFGVIFTSGEWNINMSDAVNKDNLLPKSYSAQQSDDSLTTKFWTHCRMREDRKFPQQCRWRSCSGSCLHKNLKLLTPLLCIMFKVYGCWIWIYFTTLRRTSSVVPQEQLHKRTGLRSVMRYTEFWRGLLGKEVHNDSFCVTVILRQNHTWQIPEWGGGCSPVTAAFGTSNDFMNSSNTSWLWSDIRGWSGKVIDCTEFLS